MKAIIGLMAVLGCILLAACSNGNNDQQAVATENAMLSTEISAVRATATYQRDQLQITLEYIQTAVTEVAEEHQKLALLLATAGIDATVIAQVSPGANIIVTSTPQPQHLNPSDPLATQEVDPNISALTPTSGAPTVYNAVMAEGVGNNDCALAAMTTFPSSVENIYVVATAANVTPGTILGSQWFDQDGKLLVSHDFTPDFEIQQNCIWFYVDSTDFAFAPGSYSVQLLVNNTPVGTPVPFTIQ